jgi:allophanate hydrolase
VNAKTSSSVGVVSQGDKTPRTSADLALRVRAAYARIEEVERPEIWITLRPMEDVLAEATAVDPSLPLAGLLVAVKDNVDVAGLPTTAGCPAFAFVPAATAPAVARLVAAGAVVLGKTNMDQFATGLVGTRSPHGAVRDARRPDHVSGGSSSGSAVAVALGIADIGVGTDTAGSGRVPAAFGGIVGVKPTRGLVPNRGSVPACRTLDCITTFGRDLATAVRAAGVMAGVDAGDPTSRAWPADAPLAAPSRPRVGVPGPASLPGLTAAAAAAFAAAAERLADAGAELVALDPQALLEAGALLYDGAFVAERHAAVGAFVDAHPGDVDPTVGAIISAAGRLTARDLVADGERLDALRLRVAERFADLDAILLPTTTRQPTIAEVKADPVGANSRLGLFTNCANLLDLCAVAVPAGDADGGRFGVSVLAPAFADAVAAGVAALLVGEPLPADAPAPPGVELLVVGAHRTGQPLNHELTSRGARPRGVVWTAPEYRLHALRTTPPKPGLVRVPDGGVAIEGELWTLSPAALGSFLAALPAPMTLGRAVLDDGREVVGFTCEAAALEGAPDISEYRSWIEYLRVAAA